MGVGQLPAGETSQSGPVAAVGMLWSHCLMQPQRQSFRHLLRPHQSPAACTRHLMTNCQRRPALFPWTSSLQWCHTEVDSIKDHTTLFERHFFHSQLSMAACVCARRRLDACSPPEFRAHGPDVGPKSTGAAHSPVTGILRSPLQVFPSSSCLNTVSAMIGRHTTAH